MLKVGDRVKMIDKCRMYKWHTDDYYFVVRIDGLIVTLNKSIVDYSNIINIVYLYLAPISEERYKKLRQICSR